MQDVGSRLAYFCLSKRDQLCIYVEKVPRVTCSRSSLTTCLLGHVDFECTCQVMAPR